MKTIFRAALIGLLTLLIVVDLNAQTKEQIFKEFKNNYSMYWSGTKFLLNKTKIDPFILSLMDKALPKVADQDVKGAILEISNVFYEKKGIKELNPGYTKYLENKFEYLLKVIPKKDYFEIILALSDIVLVSDNFFNKNIVPDESFLNKNKEVDLVADTSSISHDIIPIVVDHELIKNDLEKLNVLSQKINLVTFSPFGGFVIIYGEEIEAKSIPKKAEDRINELISQKQVIKSVTFTATGGYVILYGKNGVISSSIPKSAYEKLKELNEQKRDINFVTFIPDGGYIIVYNDYYYMSKNMPSGLSETLKKANTNKLKIKSIAFESDGGYVVNYGSNGYSSEGIPAQTSKKLHELHENSKTIDFVSFIPGGGHVIVYNGFNYLYETFK